MTQLPQGRLWSRNGFQQVKLAMSWQGIWEDLFLASECEVLEKSASPHTHVRGSAPSQLRRGDFPSLWHRASTHAGSSSG